MGKLGMMRKLVNPKLISKEVRQAYRKHPQKKIIEKITFDVMFDREHAEFENVLEKVVEGKKMGFVDKNSLGLLVRRLQRGQGYSADTEKAFREELPEIIDRIKDEKQTDGDVEEIKKLMQWLAWAKEDERIRVMEKKGLI